MRTCPPLNFHFSAVKSECAPSIEGSSPAPCSDPIFQFRISNEEHFYVQICFPLPCLEGATKFSNFLEKRRIYGQFLWFHSSENRQNAFLLDSAEWVKAFARITLVFDKKMYISTLGVQKKNSEIMFHVMKVSHYFKHHILLTPRQGT